MHNFFRGPGRTHQDRAEFISEGGDPKMPGIKLREGETFEQALRRFKKQCEKAGILSELRKREHYEKPSIKMKKKRAQAKKRSRRPTY